MGFLSFFFPSRRRGRFRAIAPVTGYTSPLGRHRQNWTEWFWKGGGELQQALGQGAPGAANHDQALALAREGANAWFARDQGAGSTNLQHAVRQGWLDVVEALLWQMDHWVWHLPGARSWQQQHLASLWLVVNTIEMEALLWEQAPLSAIDRAVWTNEVVLENLLDHLCENGMTRTLAWVLEQLPEAFCQGLVRQSRIGHWALDSLLCVVRHDPKVLEVREDAEKICVLHSLAITTEGLGLLQQLGRKVDRMDKERNNALMIWCLSPWIWRTGPRTQDGWQGTVHLPDTQTYAQQTLTALLEAGVDPLHTNCHGLTAGEAALHMEQVPAWWRLRGNLPEGVRVRVGLLEREVMARKLLMTTASCDGTRKTARL